MNAMLNYPTVNMDHKKAEIYDIGFLLIITSFIALVLTFYLVALVVIPKFSDSHDSGSTPQNTEEIYG